ncbi:LysR family transcriptional regulator [Mammaliicoccus vitulinus]|uniref:LysR family transcriptional regulator n=1 Tax=Mammaliicoccus vitulinus TaxID=71237 RepID=A0A2T4PWW0_9STAP|nr:LysR family transcriptional regulator [Mammaliicoccus vitulinus]PTI30975.1 LysR family transcriptional regulator [Mammaliicoccus vitulinus]
MNIDYIEDFIKVAKYQSLTKASNMLNISTPALSKRIQSIENYFECDLFYRTSKGIFLNEQGTHVLNKLISIKEEMDHLKCQVLNSKNSILRIGLVPSFSLFKLANHTRNAMTNQLSIKIESNTQILLGHLHNGDIDVIIGDINFLQNDDLLYKTLYSEKYIVVYSKTSHINSAEPITIDKLKNEKILTLTPPCDTLNFIQKHLSNTKLNIDYKNDLESIFANIQAGNGITLIPESLSGRIENLNLLNNELAQHSRKVGLIAYNNDILEKSYKILST